MQFNSIQFNSIQFNVGGNWGQDTTLDILREEHAGYSQSAVPQLGKLGHQWQSSCQSVVRIT